MLALVCRAFIFSCFPSCFPAVLLSCFPAFLLSCFLCPAFLFSRFSTFLVSCFSALLLSCFPVYLLSCFPAFLCFCFPAVLLCSAFASVCLCLCLSFSLLCCACAFGFSMSLGVAFRVYSRLLRPCSVLSLPTRRRPTSLRLVDGFVGQGIGSLVVLSVDMFDFPFNSIFIESVP